MCVQMSWRTVFCRENHRAKKAQGGKAGDRRVWGGVSKRGCVGSSPAGRENAGVGSGGEGRPAWSCPGCKRRGQSWARAEAEGPMGRLLDASRAEGSSGHGEMGWTWGVFKGKARRTRR